MPGQDVPSPDGLDELRAVVAHRWDLVVLQPGCHGHARAHGFVDERLVQEVTAAGGRVICWTSNTPSEWRVFRDIGVAGICTDLAIYPHATSAPSPGVIANALVV